MCNASTFFILFRDINIVFETANIIKMSTFYASFPYASSTLLYALCFIMLVVFFDKVFFCFLVLSFFKLFFCQLFFFRSVLCKQYRAFRYQYAILIYVSKTSVVIGSIISQRIPFRKKFLRSEYHLITFALQQDKMVKLGYLLKVLRV